MLTDHSTLFAGVVVPMCLFLMYVRRRNKRKHIYLYESASILRHESMVNCRDIGGLPCYENGVKIGSVRHGLFYRSAWPVWCGAEEFKNFTRNSNIKLLLDVRSEREFQSLLTFEKDVNALFPRVRPAISHNYNVTAPKRKPSHVAPRRKANSVPKRNADGTLRLAVRTGRRSVQEQNISQPVRFSIPMSPKGPAFYWLAPQLNAKTLLQLVVHSIIGSPEHVTWRPLFNQFKVAETGLGNIYTMFLESSKAEIALVFRSLIWSGSQNSAALIHCMQGKDRTGILTGILLMFLGVPHDDIVNDYKHSHTQFLLVPNIMESVRSTATKMFGSATGELFAGANNDSMNVFVNYVTTTYGGGEAFLKHCGLTDEELQALKHLYIKTE